MLRVSSGQKWCGRRVVRNDKSRDEDGGSIESESGRRVVREVASGGTRWFWRVAMIEMRVQPARWVSDAESGISLFRCSFFGTKVEKNISTKPP